MKKFFTLVLQKFVLIAPILVIATSVHGQETAPNAVSFKITNSQKGPVAFATVHVVNRADSLKADKKITDSTGVVTFNLEKGGQYVVNISSVSYQPMEKHILVTDQRSFIFSLESLPKTLGGVVVTSSKPLFKQEDDKTIIDPENLVAASTNVYEVIEKTPGLFVDQDGNIYISSLTPARVQINGRDMNMSASDMATLLKSLPPNAILKIEIVRTPSAKYDAASTGGVVNVVLKKGVKIGMTGSVNSGMQQGKYGNQFAGININNNNGDKSSFYGINYSHRDSYERIVTDRILSPDTLLSQNALTRYPANSWFANYGVVFPLSKKWDFDFGTSVSINDFNNKTDNQNDIKKTSSGELITRSLNNIGNDGSTTNYRIGINTKLKIDTLGSEWSNDIFYNYTGNKAEQIFNTSFDTPLPGSAGGNGVNNSQRNFYQATSDLKLKLPKRLTLETGAKSTLLYFKSVADYFKESGGGTIKDPERTNTFHYSENINALYLQGSKTFGKDIILKLGARLENTNMEGKQIVPEDTSFNIHRTDLFPYIYLSKSVMHIAGFELRAYLVYRRTITRPVYEQLNPFPRYVDQYLSEAGNPTLRPQFNQNYEANISVDERPLLAVGVNDTKDIFTQVVYPLANDTTHAYTVRTYDNLGKNKEWYLRGLGAIPPGKRYFFVLGAQYNHNFYQGFYEKNSPLAFKKGTWTFFTYHTYKVDKRSVITLNGFIRLKGQQQFYELTPFGALNASINRKFLKDKLIVTLSANDIFFTNKNNFTINQGSIDASGFREADTRRFGINFRYNFGVKKKEENNNMFNVESPERSN